MPTKPERLASLLDDLLSTDAAKGPALIGVNDAADYPDGSLGQWLTDIKASISQRSLNALSFGARDNGTDDNTAILNPKIAELSALGGGIIDLPVSASGGTYRFDAPIVPKSNVMLRGVGAERSRLLASGNFPVVEHRGDSGNTLGRFGLEKLQVRGGGNGLSKSYGVFIDWGAGCWLEDVDIRLCRIGYFQGTSRNNILRKVRTNSNYVDLWFGPIDASGGGTPDNTVFLGDLDFINTVSDQIRVEGMTGMKGYNASLAATGARAMYAGDYTPASSPRAILDGNTVNVPSLANARNIRFITLSAFKGDTTNTSAFVFKGVGGGGANDVINDVQLVGCWGGNVKDAAAASFHFENFRNVILTNTLVDAAFGSALNFKNGEELTVNGFGINDYDSSDNGAPAIKLENVSTAGLSGGYSKSATSTQVALSYMVHLKSCDLVTIDGIKTPDAKLFLVEDSVRVSASNCETKTGGVAILETGSSNFNRYANCQVPGGFTIVGAASSFVHTGDATNPRTLIVGGSASEPAITLGAGFNSGFYRVGTKGISYSRDGAPVWGIYDDNRMQISAEIVPAITNVSNLGRPSNFFLSSFSRAAYYTATVFDSSGTGSPEGVVTAAVGSTYRRTDGGAATSLYVKESGTGNTGWVAK